MNGKNIIHPHSYNDTDTILATNNSIDSYKTLIELRKIYVESNNEAFHSLERIENNKLELKKYMIYQSYYDDRLTRYIHYCCVCGISTLSILIPYYIHNTFLALAYFIPSFLSFVISSPFRVLDTIIYYCSYFLSENIIQNFTSSETIKSYIELSLINWFEMIKTDFKDSSNVLLMISSIILFCILYMVYIVLVFSTNVAYGKNSVHVGFLGINNRPLKHKHILSIEDKKNI